MNGLSQFQIISTSTTTTRSVFFHKSSSDIPPRHFNTPTISVLAQKALQPTLPRKKTLITLGKRNFDQIFPTSFPTRIHPDDELFYHPYSHSRPTPLSSSPHDLRILDPTISPQPDPRPKPPIQDMIQTKPTPQISPASFKLNSPPQPTNEGNPRTIIGKRVRAERKKFPLTKKKILSAKRLSIKAGLPPEAIVRIENGSRSTKQIELSLIAKALNLKSTHFKNLDIYLEKISLTFGQRKVLKAKRLTLNISAENLSKSVGCSPDQIVNIEEKSIKISEFILDKLLRALEISNTLLFGSTLPLFSLSDPRILNSIIPLHLNPQPAIKPLTEQGLPTPPTLESTAKTTEDNPGDQPNWRAIIAARVLDVRLKLRQPNGRTVSAAQLSDAAGLATNAINSIELKKRSVTEEELKKIALAAGLKSDHFSNLYPYLYCAQLKT